MQFKQPSIGTKSALYRSLLAGGLADRVLRGRGLVMDPSCGSASSEPGYCVLLGGEVLDSGRIDMSAVLGQPIERRLHYLAECLRRDFPEKFDFVVVEDVPTHRFSRGRHGRKYANFGSQLSLHYACGVILATFDVHRVLRVSPATWWSFAPDGYEKSDESDAVVMAHAVIEVARHVAANRDTPTKRRGRGKKKKSAGGR